MTSRCRLFRTASRALLIERQPASRVGPNRYVRFEWQRDFALGGRNCPYEAMPPMPLPHNASTKLPRDRSVHVSTATPEIEAAAAQPLSPATAFALTCRIGSSSTGVYSPPAVENAPAELPAWRRQGGRTTDRHRIRLPVRDPLRPEFRSPVEPSAGLERSSPTILPRVQARSTSR
jgi:hypothetical protein